MELPMERSDYKKYIILNFAYGFGPFIKAVETAIRVNDILSKKGHERLGIIVPLVYEDRYKKITKENFDKYIKKYPKEILFDRKIGQYLSEIFYEGESYRKYLRSFLKSSIFIEKEIKKYLKGTLKSEDLQGNIFKIKGKNIMMEIGRSPRINFGIALKYYFGFANMSDVFSNFLLEYNDLTDLDKKILKEAVIFYKKLEKKCNINFISEPGTFYYIKKKIYNNYSKQTIFTPPHSESFLIFNKNKHKSNASLKKGVYITVSGIPNIKKVFKKIPNLNLKIYTNNRETLSVGKNESPNIIGDKNILFHIARSGWGSVWRSLLTETPFIAFPYDKEDDPEIYFNNKCIEDLGIGLIFESQTSNEIFLFRNKYIEKVKKLKSDLIKKYDTLDGIQYLSERIVDHFSETKLK